MRLEVTIEVQDDSVLLRTLKPTLLEFPARQVEISKAELIATIMVEQSKVLLKMSREELMVRHLEVLRAAMLAQQFKELSNLSLEDLAATRSAG